MKRVSEQALTTFAKRTVFGPSLVSSPTVATDAFAYFSSQIARTLAAWLNILAAAADKGIVGIKGVLLDHYKKYGRTFFSR